MNLIILIFSGNSKIFMQTQNLQHEFCQYYNITIIFTKLFGCWQTWFLNFTRIICCSCSIIVRQIMQQTLPISISNAFIKNTQLRLTMEISCSVILLEFFFYLKVLFSFCGVFKKKQKTLLMFSFFVPVRLVEINITNFFYCMIKWSLIEMTYFVC